MSASARCVAAAAKAPGKSSARRTSRSCGVRLKDRAASSTCFVAHVEEAGDACEPWKEFSEELNPLSKYFDVNEAEPRDVPARVSEAGDEAGHDRITNGCHHHRNGSCRALCRQSGWRPPRQDQIYLQANQLTGQARELFVAAVC